MRPEAACATLSEVKVTFIFGLAALLTGVAAVGCGGAPGTAATPATPVETTAAVSPPIAEVHRARCGACHVRVEPGTRTREQLETAFSRHKKRARLSDEQWAALVEYLAAPTPRSASVAEGPAAQN